MIKVKEFKIFGLMDSYIILKCPSCGWVFRYNFLKKVFGNKIKNAKCQHCEEMFNILNNQLDEDPVFRPWDSKEIIMVKPSGKQEIYKPEKEKSIPEIKEAKE